MKFSYKNNNYIIKFTCYLKTKFKDKDFLLIKVSRGKTSDYLGIILDHKIKKSVNVGLVEHIEKITEGFQKI